MDMVERTQRKDDMVSQEAGGGWTKSKLLEQSSPTIFPRHTARDPRTSHQTQPGIPQRYHMHFHFHHAVINLELGI